MTLDLIPQRGAMTRGARGAVWAACVLLAALSLAGAARAREPGRNGAAGFEVSEVPEQTEDAAAPVRPGAGQAPDSPPRPPRVRGYVHWLQWTVFVGLALLLLATASLRRPRLAFMRLAGRRLPTRAARLLRYLLFQRLLWQIIRTVSLFVLVWLAGSAVMYLFEREVNAHFSNLKVSSLSILVYLFSGLEDRAPMTTGGWIGSVVMLISGLLIAAYITGQFASEIMRQTFGVIHMTKNSAKGSMLIVGWNPRAERVVHEMFGAFEVNMPEHNVTVLSSERVDTFRFPEFEARGVTFVSGDTFDKKLLSRIGAHTAHSVTIMADTSNEDPDAVTALTVLAVRSLCREEEVTEEARPRICVEVVNHRKMSLVCDAGADEVICHEDFGLGVLAQSAFSAKLTGVYQELLSYSVTSCEIYMLTSPREGHPSDIPNDVWAGLFAGKSFVEASEVLNQNRDAATPPILIGVERGNKVLLNPRDHLRLQDGDNLIVIAYVRPRLESLRHAIPART